MSNNDVVPEGVIARGQDAIIRIVEQRQREEDAKNPHVRPPELDTPIVPQSPLIRIFIREVGAANEAHLRRYGRLPDLTPVRDDR